MLVINSSGALTDPHARQNCMLKKYAINTLVFLWKVIWNTIATILRVFAFCFKIISYAFFAFTAIILLRRWR